MTIKNNFDGKLIFLLLAFYAGMWPYQGWNTLNYIAEEVKNPSSTLPIVICKGIKISSQLFFTTIVSKFSGDFLEYT